MIPLEEAETRILTSLDLLERPERMEAPVVARSQRNRLTWLLEASRRMPPPNPFPKGSLDHREAEGLRALVSRIAPLSETELMELAPRLTGSRLLLWRWGQAQVRAGRWSPTLRQAWENRLLEPSNPALLRGWALRHALCFALAEANEERYADLVTRMGPEARETLAPFQRAFGLLGGPAPLFRLWRLPDLEPEDLPLASRPGATVYITPFEQEGMPPEECLWIIPSPEGSLPPEEPRLKGPERVEALDLAEHLRKRGRRAFLAASRAPFEALALSYFPIQLQIDAKGRVASIHMGDAALQKEKASLR